MADTDIIDDSRLKIHQREGERSPAQPEGRRFPTWHQLALAGITLISFLMNFYQLGKNGYSSYYSAAIRSMMDSWHNFFFAAYDPGAFVSIDKPPVGFWLEVLSAKIFGFNSVSILLPQATCGVLSVLLLYYLVRRRFGVGAGLLAALALSPISILTNRNITIDSTLALVLLAGAWAVLRAAESGRLRWLLLCAFIVGVGFNIKMLEAYLVVPAFGLLYLLAAPRSIWRRIAHLALAAALLLVISLSWVTIVDLTPASHRPYVGSTQDNSELSLALGYNGIQRLLGQFGSGGGSRPGGFSGAPPTTSGAPPTNAGGRSFNPGGGGLFDIGTAGPLRLFIQPLAGQTAWLLPLALLGALALAWQRRPRLRDDHQQQSVLLWGMWLLTMGVFFSVAGFFHQYYLTEMAPAIAALFGIGLVTMWQDYRRGGWRGWLLPIALVAAIAEQVSILSGYPTWGQVLIPILVVTGCIVVGALVAARSAPMIRAIAFKTRLLAPALALGVLVLLISPTVWAAVPILTSTQADTLVAGPTTENSFGGFRASGQNQSGGSDTALLSYLEAQQGAAKFLVAVSSSNEADSIILATNRPVMTLGGFSGSDPILTTSQLAALVKNGTVRYFLLNGSDGGRGGTGGAQSTLTTWIKQHSKVVSTSQWQSVTTNGGFGGSQQLYEYTGQ
jgi:4-amino-4-deoxy-L-arabinose transferase-like glycosyltransferase